MEGDSTLLLQKACTLIPSDSRLVLREVHRRRSLWCQRNRRLRRTGEEKDIAILLGVPRGSYVNRCYVEITYQDCTELLYHSTIGDKLHILYSYPDYDWALANHFLRNTNAHFHVRESSTLLKDTRTIQHVHCTSILRKIGGSKRSWVLCLTWVGGKEADLTIVSADQFKSEENRPEHRPEFELADIYRPEVTKEVVRNIAAEGRRPSLASAIKTSSFGAVGAKELDVQTNEDIEKPDGDMGMDFTLVISFLLMVVNKFKFLDVKDEDQMEDGGNDKITTSSGDRGTSSMINDVVLEKSDGCGGKSYNDLMDCGVAKEIGSIGYWTRLYNIVETVNVILLDKSNSTPLEDQELARNVISGDSKFISMVNIKLSKPNKDDHVGKVMPISWVRKPNIRIDNLDFGSFLTKDDNLNSEKEWENTKKLENALCDEVLSNHKFDVILASNVVSKLEKTSMSNSSLNFHFDNKFEVLNGVEEEGDLGNRDDGFVGPLGGIVAGVGNSPIVGEKISRLGSTGVVVNGGGGILEEGFVKVGSICNQEEVIDDRASPRMQIGRLKICLIIPDDLTIIPANQFKSEENCPEHRPKFELSDPNRPGVTKGL
ncbi:hypothetical protein MA16_Dca002741 [Dendrobium catenatum]|uniref:Uncharacterized protein n=1 Tax=Dendrobium catenatum TaxID=906689 RepID=A0A2I0X8I3_9ASPA|nr:hypothetical protein MA16_Dca002741 [Dendrobium catenatum]